MLSYYTSVLILVWLALLILCILVKENDHIEDANRSMFYMTYGVIAFSALSEWLGFQFEGREDIPVLLLRAVKCCDFIFTPIAGGALVGQMNLRNRIDKLLTGVLAANAVFQIIAFFTGWMMTVDEHHFLVQGPLYIVYVLLYVFIIVMVVVQFLTFGKSYKKQNRASLYVTMGLIIIGVLMQEVIGGDVRTAYLAFTLGVALLFIHISEFVQQKTDEHIQMQQRMITTDVLTGVKSRYAYANVLKRYESAGQLPENLVAFVIDINNLKETNDSLGHEAGDELICGAASCIQKVFAEADGCYRTGGDEFLVLGKMSKAHAAYLLAQLKSETQHWHGSLVGELSLAAGSAFATDHPQISCEKLVQEADLAMYEAKAQYYEASGKDRRRGFHTEISPAGDDGFLS